MRSFSILGVAALALAAAAAEAQPNPGFGPINGKDPPPVTGSTPVPHPGLSKGRGLPANIERQIAADLKTTVPQMRLACAADRRSLCANETTTPSADRCLRYYRLKVSRPCRTALDRVTMAAQGRL
jgi:hypothetical protein